MSEEVNTTDELVYQFRPVSSGSLTFKVRAANDAHVALTSQPSDSDPIIEIFIGGWGNSKTVIRRNKTKPEKAELETPGILSDSEFRGFWLRWQGGHIACGKEGETTPFIEWEDPDIFGINYYGVSTGWGATGSWVMQDICRMVTTNNCPYAFNPIYNASIELSVLALNNAYVGLAYMVHQDSQTMIVIAIGTHGNTRVSILKDTTILAVRNHQFILSTMTPLCIQIKWDHTGHIKVFDVRQNEPRLIIDWNSNQLFYFQYFALKTHKTDGRWLLGDIQSDTKLAKEWVGWALPEASATGGLACWVDAKGGEIPPNAVPGGFDNEQLYIGRARHEGALIPGKVVPSHNVCYIPWGGAEHGKDEYQVLCGCEAAWIPAVGGNIPDGALPSGETEDGEPLFVGRSHHEGTVTVGKVQQSHNCCYIPYGGQEIGYPEYEVLVAK